MESVFTIKEYAQEILLFVVRVDYADINFELGASDVAFHPIAKLFYGFCDSLCYSAVACAFCGAVGCYGKLSTLGKLQKAFKSCNALGTCP